MRGRVLALAAAIVVSAVLFIDLCGWVFGCGCRSLWAGAALDCDIHEPAPPDCPWCAHPASAGAVAFAATAMLQTWILLGRGRAGVALRLALALLSFPLTAGLLGTLQGVLWKYWG